MMVMHVGIISGVDQYLFTYSIFSFDILIRIHSIYIINTYIPLMDRVNSMVMSEKLN